MNLWRGDVEPERGSYVFPILTAKLHLWELTDQINEQGFYISLHHTIASLRFQDVSELVLSGFNHQNAIFGLSIVRKERNEGHRRRFWSNSRRPSGLRRSSYACALGSLKQLHAIEMDELNETANPVMSKRLGCRCNV